MARSERLVPSAVPSPRPGGPTILTPATPLPGATRPLGAAARRRLLQAVLLLGGLVVLGMVCGARAHAEQGGPSGPVSVQGAAHPPRHSGLGMPNLRHSRHTSPTTPTSPTEHARHARHRHLTGHLTPRHLVKHHATDPTRQPTHEHLATHRHHSAHPLDGTHPAHLTHPRHLTHPVRVVHPGPLPGHAVTDHPLARPSAPSDPAHRAGSRAPGRSFGPVVPGRLPGLAHGVHGAHGGAVQRPSVPGVGPTAVVASRVPHGVREAVRDTEGPLHRVAARVLHLPGLPALPVDLLPGGPGPAGRGGADPAHQAAGAPHGNTADAAADGTHGTVVLGPRTPATAGTASHGAPLRHGNAAARGVEGPGPVPVPVPVPVPGGGGPTDALCAAQDAGSGAQHRPGDLRAVLSGTRVPVPLVRGAVGARHAAAVHDRYRDILEFPG